MRRSKTLNTTEPDKWLFGKQLKENLKTAKALEASRKDLKMVQKLPSQRNLKNSKAPPPRSLNNQKSLATLDWRKGGTRNIHLIAETVAGARKSTKGAATGSGIRRKFRHRQTQTL